MRNPNQNLEYRMNSKGRMVVVEKYDPETMELFTLTPDMEPTEEQLEMLKKASEKPVVYDDDCPELTPPALQLFCMSKNPVSTVPMCTNQW